MEQREHFTFSVSVQSGDFFMISGMRGLAWRCQSEINRQIAVKGTTEPNWKRNGNKAIFFFTSPSNRELFVEQARRLFQSGWKEVSRKNDDLPPKKD
jgi:hypothetical protein